MGRGGLGLRHGDRLRGPRPPCSRPYTHGHVFQRTDRTSALSLAKWTGGTPLAVVIAGVGMLAATIVMANLVSPLRSAAPVAYDTSAIVLQFERIVTGQIMEAHVPMPKPLLGLIYGPIWELTHDWRPIEWTAVLALAASAALATVLAWRVAGLPAGLFAGVGIASSSMLILEAVRALATPWAILGWMVAGLAITAGRPRYLVTGVALMLATLARIETVIPLVVAASALVLARVGPLRVRRSLPRSAWLLLLGFLAFPVMMVHDWLLIRDPMYWAGASGAYAADHPTTSGLRGIVRLAHVLSDVLVPMTGMLVLGVVGLVLLWRHRQLALMLGLLCLGAGVSAFLLMLGWVGYFVPSRFVAPVVVAVIMAAAIGYGALRVGTLRAGPATAADRPVRLRSRGALGRCKSVIAPLLAVVAALGLSMPIAPLDPALLARARTLRETHRNATLALPALRAAVQEAQAAPRARGSPRLVVVPNVLKPRMTLELGLPFNDIQGFADLGGVDLAAGRPAVGQIVLYEQVTDPQRLGAVLAVSSPTRVAGVIVDPVFVDPAHATWVVRIRLP